MSEDSLMSRHHVFGCCFAEVDLSHWILERGKLLAWATWLSIHTERCLSELDLLSVRKLVVVDVGDTHCGVGNV